MRDIAAHKLEKVYFLEGTEGYFIDKIAEAVTSAALTNDQKDFNQIVYYGADVSVGQIINTAKKKVAPAKNAGAFPFLIIYIERVKRKKNGAVKSAPLNH